MNPLLQQSHDDFKPLWVENRSRRFLRQLVREQASRRFAVETNQYVPYNVADTNRGPSPVIWHEAKIAAVQQDPSLGMDFFEDFLSCSNAVASTTSGVLAADKGWALYCGANASFATDPNLEGGVVNITSSSATGGSLTLSNLAGWTRMIAPTTYIPNKKIYFECRVALGYVGTTTYRDFFIGLTDTGAPASTNPFASSNVLTTTPGLIGFQVGGVNSASGKPPTSDFGLVYNVAGGTPVYPVNLRTLVTTATGTAVAAYSATAGVASNFHKLGFIYDPTPDNPALRVTSATGNTTYTQTAGALLKPILQVFVDGIALPSFLDYTMIAASTFPSTFLAPIIGYVMRNSSDTGVYVDWIRCFADASI